MDYAMKYWRERDKTCHRKTFLMSYKRQTLSYMERQDQAQLNMWKLH